MNIREMFTSVFSILNQSPSSSRFSVEYRFIAVVDDVITAQTRKQDYLYNSYLELPYTESI